MTTCTCATLREKSKFSDYEEFDAFESVLASSGFVKVPVTIEEPVDHDERWYRCPNCGSTWSLMPPDFPFPGRWTTMRGI